MIQTIGDDMSARRTRGTEGELKKAKDRIRFLEGSNLAILESLDRIESLTDFQQKVNPLQNVESIYQNFLREIVGLIETEACSLFLVDDETSEFCFKIAMPREAEDACRKEVDAQIESGVLAWVVTQRKPVVTRATMFRRGNQEVSTVTVPIFTSRNIFGVVIIVTPIEERLVPLESLKLISVVTKQASLAIENAILYDDFRKQNESLKTTRKYLKRSRANIRKDNELLKQEIQKKIRELHVANDELLTANQKLEEMSRLKSEFLANMSHELRTPLNSIIGFSEILKDGLAGDMTEEQIDYAGNIHKSGNHLLSIINDILDLSKVEAGKMEFHWDKVDLELVLEDVRDTMSPIAGKKQQSLAVEIVDGARFAYGDALRISQIVMNLLSNASKFTPEGGSINVRAQLPSSNAPPSGLPLEGDFIQISVSDTGIGLKYEDQAKIFEEFRQVDGSHARKFEGTGLGLAITKKLVEKHGGSIWIESELGEGSTFSFVVPKYTADVDSGELDESGARSEELGVMIELE
ncbi:MAG: ATP-binding protein [Pseudomonadota bacterium]